MEPRKNHTTIAVAMSGGVDSSVAAWRLLEQGHRVIGVTMAQLPADPTDRPTAAEEAAAVCRHLGIEHHVIDLRAVFRSCVIEPFIADYMRGATPNPCVHCNHLIKWGALREFATGLGADLIATGHYARAMAAPEGFELHRAAIVEKDQSYALWRLTQEQLGHTLFPLGGLSKAEVRRLAAGARLPVAHKAESQEICFIPEDDYRAFIAAELDRSGRAQSPGDIVDQNGRVVGRHRGYPYYTVGQRKGLGVALGRPVFVTRIDAESNRVYIGDREDLLVNGLTAGQANWISGRAPGAGTRVQGRIRYRDPGYEALLESASSEQLTLRFLQPRPAVTPGQSAVLYENDRVLGGGIITAAMP